MTDRRAPSRPTGQPSARTPARPQPKRATRRQSVGYSLPQILVRLPLLAREVRSVRRDVPRLPEASGREGVASAMARSDRIADDSREHHLVVLGDSVAAGVGIDHHRNSIAGRLACRMSESLEHAVAWHVIARSGADASDVLRLTHDTDAETRLRQADAAVISVGVNDVKNLRTETAWRDSLTALLERVTTLLGDAPVILLGVPPMNEFPAMPEGLGRVFGERCVRFDAIADDAAAAFPTVERLPLMESKLVRSKAFGEDGFHPSPWLHKKLAKEIAARLAQRDTPTS